MSVSKEQVLRKKHSIITEINQMPDGFHVEKQIDLLQTKINELAECWKTEGAEKEIASYQQFVNDLQCSTLSKSIHFLKSLKPVATTVHRYDTRI